MLKLIIDFKSKDSLEIINYFYELNKEQKQELEIHGYDLDKDEQLNKAYYSLYYANKFGVGLDYTKRILDAYHNENQDINSMATLAKLYQEIGYNPNDMIDALIEGDYEEMHKYAQYRFIKDELNDTCSIYYYNDQGLKEDTICGTQNIINYLNK